MITRFDHAVIAVSDLNRTGRLYQESLGLSPYVGGRHTGLGTHNEIVRFGLDYLELLGIYDRHEVMMAGYRRASLAEYLDRAGGGLIGFCLATADIDALAERFRSTGLAATGPFDMERRRPDGTVIRWRLLVPGNTSWRRPWPFFIQWDMPDAERLRVEKPGVHPLGVRRVVALSVMVNDLESAGDLYCQQIGLMEESRWPLPALDAHCMRLNVPGLTLDLLAPTGSGIVQDTISAQGEGLFGVVHQVDDLAAARTLLAANDISLQPAPEHAGAWLIPPAEAEGARLLLIEKEEKNG